MTNTTKIALIQMRCGPEPEKNFARATEFVREAAGKGAQIVCFPELFRSQYFCQTEDHKNFELAEEVPGESTAALGDVARETEIHWQISQDARPGRSALSRKILFCAR